jgi:hypothetical protein
MQELNGAQNIHSRKGMLERILCQQKEIYHKRRVKI